MIDVRIFYLETISEIQADFYAKYGLSIVI